jgi:hypothetical protein
MLSIRNKNQSNSREQEGRIQLVLSNLKNGKIRSIHKAVEIYNVTRLTF